MSTRWFFSYARQGATAEVAADGGFPTVVEFERTIDGEPTTVSAPGPKLRLTGPGDVAAIDRGLIMREQPAPGTIDAPENVMASVEFAHADMPWVLPNGVANPTHNAQAQPVPWLVLIVLSEHEAGPPVDADPVPRLTAPMSALPPLAETWAWAHVEARLDEADPVKARGITTAGVRQRSAQVVARLVCPRKLQPDTNWIAAVVPAPSSGQWSHDAAGMTELQVFHWWTFHTGPGGTFEGLARLLRKADADLGIGSRTIDVSTPWPPKPGEAVPAPATVTVTLDGALRPLGPAEVEAFSDQAAKDAFCSRLVGELNTPADRHDPARQVDPAAMAVGPPLYGSHFSDAQRVENGSSDWLATLNIEVRRRVAAALGARYVQVEQEFLMARAWEQIGQIRQANRMLAVAELAAGASNASHLKNIAPLSTADMVTTFAPLAARVQSMASMLSGPEVPDGIATTAFSRLARTGGALARRITRMSGADFTVDAMVSGLIEPMAGSADTMTAVAEKTRAMPLQLLRMRDVIALEGPDLIDRQQSDERPLAPLMAHPHFDAPIATEILSRWSEWALPGITDLPMNTVMVLETNPGFVAALLVGLNQEFNRELLWREFPTDQRGTPFRRFWPTAGDDIDEIARWPGDSTLGSQLLGGEQGSIVLVVRGEVLRRYPASTLVAVKGVNGEVPETFTGVPATPLPLDDSTVLFLFTGISEEAVRAQDWFFVLREPLRGTQFGFDLEPPQHFETWADLIWSQVAQNGAGYVQLRPPPPNPPQVVPPPPGEDAPVWDRDAADMARIAFQQPFQLAFRAQDWLRA